MLIEKCMKHKSKIIQSVFKKSKFWCWLTYGKLTYNHSLPGDGKLAQPGVGVGEYVPRLLRVSELHPIIPTPGVVTQSL